MVASAGGLAIFMAGCDLAGDLEAAKQHLVRAIVGKLGHAQLARSPQLSRHPVFNGQDN